MTDTISDLDYRRLARFRNALRQFAAFSEAAARAAGLTPQQHQALLAMRGHAGPSAMSVGALAEQLMVHHNSAVGLVDRLVAEGLVERRQAADDRRRVELHLTAAADRVLAKLTITHREEIRRIGPELAAVISAIAAAR
jgi:DNA-binding MarR family transcriptional regulator